MKQRTLFRTQTMGEGDVMARFAWAHDLLGNVTSQSETWPGEPTRPGTRTTSMAYDANNRLTNETVDDPPAGTTATAYAYDAANNRSTKQVQGGTDPGQWSYSYNAANQLTSWQKQSDGSPAKSAALTYDAAGNRIAQTISENGNAPQSTLYAWDAQDRLASVTMPDGSQHGYEYDYRTRRIATTRNESASTAIVFAGGLSLAEYETANSTPTTANGPTVEYTRGPDMGGGVGGMLYSLRSGAAKYSLSNGRGDIVAQADQAATLTWTASYEAYGKRTKETGTNQDKQRANSKDEDPTGLLNEGFRYRDIETGVWLSRDPAGFVDGPNLYAYVSENPWSKFDPDGLSEVYLVGGVRREPDYINDHDTSAHHFYTAAARVAQKRAAALKKAGSSERVTVVMYEPAYETRAINDKKVDASGKPDPQYHRKLMEKAAKRDGYDLNFVKDEKEMITATAKATAKDPMKNGGYFGHSNKNLFLVNYGENSPAKATDPDGATKLIGADDFKTGGVKFDPNAKFTSYGCHQGAPGGMMEKLSNDQKIETTGSVGETLYGPIGQGQSIPNSKGGYKTYPKPKPKP